MWLMWNLIFVRSVIVLALVQDRCTVCAERTVHSKIILDAIDGLLGDEAQLEARFSPFGDYTNLDVR
jgi:hypothetical protein